MLTTEDMESVNGGEIGTPSGGYNTDTHAFRSGSYDHFKFYPGLENHSGHGSGEPSAGQPRLLGAPSWTPRGSRAIPIRKRGRTRMPIVVYIGDGCPYANVAGYGTER